MASVLGIVKVIGTDAVKVGDCVVHVVEDIGKGAAALEKLLVDGKALAPAVKAGLTTLVADGEALSVGVVSVGSNPANFVADAAAFAALQKFVSDFVAFLPVLKQAVGEVEADLATT